MNDSLKFVVALTHHRYLGTIFTPYLVSVQEGCYSISNVVRYSEISNYDYSFSPVEKEIVRFSSKCTNLNLVSKFSREVAAQDFYEKMGPDGIKKHVLPYVEKQMYRVALLIKEQQIPLFEKETSFSHLYHEDRILVPEDFAKGTFEFTRHEGGTDYRLHIYSGGKEVRILDRKVRVATQSPCILMTSNILLIFNNIDAKKIHPFQNHEVIKIPRAAEETYYRNFISRILRDHDIIASGFKIRQKHDKPLALLCLEPDLNYQPVFVLRFSYLTSELSQNDPVKTVVKLNYENEEFVFDKIVRNHSWEKKIEELLQSLGLVEKSGVYTLPGLEFSENNKAVWHLVWWMSGNKQKLLENGVELRQKSLDRNYFTGEQEVSFELRENHDWFDVYAVVRFGEYKFPFIKLRKYILNDIREFVLPNGETAVLPDEWFSRYRLLMPFAKGDGYVLNFHRYHFRLLHQRMELKNPEKILNLERDLESYTEISPPEGLKAKLREYQLTGFRWLFSLYRNNLGGCLADDMGLGKTLQTIAFLLKIRRLRKTGNRVGKGEYGQLSLFSEVGEEERQPASLIIMPTSLIFNWYNEIRRFAPSLTVYLHTGNQRNTSEIPEELLRNYDVILTTYGIVRNDIEFLKDTPFFCLILDESQYIKNPFSMTSKVVMQLKARHRIILTGTPIENSLSDLWTQMNFLNEGLLGSYHFFKYHFINPVEHGSGEEMGEKLKALIRPYILRRTKNEVARDLPPVMVQTLYCPMTPGQQSLYEQEKSVIRNTILATLDNKQRRKSPAIILQGLMKLRQIANHPALVEPETDADSGKFEEIFNALQSLVVTNHKVLVFSSFVMHLNLLRERIEAENWKYTLLTGQTKNRKEVLNQFREDPENHIFLISMKAGGVGLNITDADYVFIIDPWWNPAVESQAVSRAHRIGQEKHVFVYRFITENSIEQKIEQLQERKNDLADKFINDNDPFVKMTEEELLSFVE